MNDGQRLKEKRISLGLTLDDVAKKLGTSRQNVSAYESRDNLTMKSLQQFADIYRTHPAFLAGFISEEQGKVEYEADEVRYAYLRADENIQAAVRKLLDIGGAK